MDDARESQKQTTGAGGAGAGVWFLLTLVVVGYWGASWFWYSRDLNLVTAALSFFAIVAAVIAGRRSRTVRERSALFAVVVAGGILLLSVFVSELAAPGRLLGYARDMVFDLPAEARLLYIREHVLEGWVDSYPVEIGFTVPKEDVPRLLWQLGVSGSFTHLPDRRDSRSPASGMPGLDRASRYRFPDGGGEVSVEHIGRRAEIRIETVLE